MMTAYFLGNYTQDLLVNHFKTTCKKYNLDIDITVSGFNQYRQEIIDPTSRLNTQKPDVIFLSLDLYHFAEDIIYNDQIDKLKEFKKRFDETINLISNLEANLPDSKIFVDNLVLYRSVLMSTIEYNSSVSFSEIESYANELLEEKAKNSGNIVIIDLKNLILQYGSNKMIDNRMHYLAKSHWSHSGLKEISKLYCRYLKALKGIRKKCIVLDCDNTLWGGIIGDDGIENIKLSNDGEGKAYYDFQRELLKLYNRGILLAINSKNTKEIVIDMMNKHPHMLLKPEHFVSMKINWNNKAQNMKEIADEINLGFDSFVFLDDSDFEREIISNQFPEIFVPELPKDSSDFPNFLRNLDTFDFLDLTKDDFSRNKIYMANVKRDELKKTTINIEEFYYSLDMVATVGKIEDFHVPRIAQMTQKTNQFNLRTRRYTDNDVRKFRMSPDFEVYYLSLADKFGDNGIVGTAIIKINDSDAFIDSFIFSCRALGRTAETTLLNYIIKDVTKKGLKKLYGEFIPTNKNNPCKDFYDQNNFVKEKKNYWSILLENYTLKQQPWIQINQK